MTDLERLVVLARIVRKVFEKIAVLHSYPDDLCGLCHKSAQFLRRLALNHGIRTSLGGSGAHWFTVLDGMIVDVTATQFKVRSKVAVVPSETASKRGNWWMIRTLDSGYPDSKFEAEYKTAYAESRQALCCGKEKRR